MWQWRPWRKKLSSLSADDRFTEPSLVRIAGRVASPNAVVSPLSSTPAALVRLDLLERIPVVETSGLVGAIAAADELRDKFSLAGSVTLGDLLVVRADGGAEITLMVRTARIIFAGGLAPAIPLTTAPPELTPLLRHASGVGVLCAREQMLREGDRVHLEATLESAPSVVATGYRSGAGARFVARDDLGPVIVDEVLEAPDF